MTRTHPFSGLSRCLVLGLLAVLTPAASRAAPDRDSAPDTGYELLAFEAPGCNYCPVFRRDVEPTYATSRAGKTAPLRFIDVNDAQAGSFELSSPVTMVPTLVLVHNRIEIGRINGYFGRENMHHMLNALLPAE